MNPQQPLPAGQLELRPELQLAYRRQQQQILQQQQGQRLPQPYPPQFPPNVNMQDQMAQQQQQQFYGGQHPSQQQQQHPSFFTGPPHPSQQHQPPYFSGHQSQPSQQQPQPPPPPPPQQVMPPRPPIELQMNLPNPNLPVHLAQIPIQFPGPGPAGEIESTVKSEWTEKISKLMPRPLFHPNMLEDLSSKNVGFLCGIGKDVIQELIIRMVSITNILKIPSWKASAFAEVELILSYCKFLIEKIREIRAYVDRKTIKNQKLSANDFIELMALPTPPKLPENVQELRDNFLGNENFLFRVSNAFKKVEWLGENADPRNASLCFKDEVSRIQAAEGARNPAAATKKS